jgi:hypothetical protein
MASQFQLLSRTLKVCSAFAVATGSVDLCLGTSALGGSQVFTPGSTITAIADSQIRFFGSVWAGYGVMLWWTSNDLRTRQTPLALLGGISFVAGLGRLLASSKHGFGAAWVRVAMWAELLGPGVIYVIGRAQGLWS